MNNEIRKFDFRGAALRTLTDESGEPWFVAKDVCDVLGYTNASKAISDHVDSEDKLNNESLSSLGQRGGWLVNESGLYSLVLSSKLPTAKEFKRWVTHEVLPQIRRTGGYIPTSDADDDMTILAKAVMIGQRTMEEQKQRIADQQSRIDELQPKASAWDNFVDIPDALSVRDSAKLLSNLGRPVGQTKLFEWLDRHDWIFRENKHWSARQSRINAGHLMMVPSKSHGTHKDGTPFAFPPTVKVTRKGLALIARRFGEETLQLEYPKAGA
ncbi:BRO family protein [Bifidobacterium adolescentis]|uniref:BRO family protein n=2 Tax=Bifidobacterium adolescentis TaxID=1680 RepID=UPI001C2159D1|nr:phage antirepressor KilAC domain-containing protein [Bifidobacterium adolescentis]MBU9009987.1 phage antirepressor KilAC domain-containing protein [Bifidobacterium adolescentis]MBU9101376.1 phage antirepressor KilAC domain-containing protein [Bifidobacterium adolescentis]